MTSAELVVVGSRHHGRADRLMSGDHAMQVLHGAPCAVLVAPDDLAPCTRLTRIGVGVDDTPESAVALALALELAARTGAHVDLLAVANEVYAGPVGVVPGAGYADIYPLMRDARLQIAHDAITAARAACATAGVSCTSDARLGDPATELTAFGASCDLLVLGSRRWGPVRRLALGSTSERVIRHAPCPVLVPPRGAGAGEHDAEPRTALSSVVM